MSYTLRSRRVAYDNIAVGSATGREYPAVAQAGSTERTGGKDLIAIGGNRTTDNAISRMISGAGVTTLEPREYPVNQN